MIGNETSSASVLCVGGGESEAVQLAKTQPEELVVASPESEPECSTQVGFGSHEARKAFELEENGSVVEGPSLILSGEVGDLVMAPQIASSMVSAVLGDSEVGTKLVEQGQEEGKLEMVICSKEEDIGGYIINASLVGSLAGNCLWEDHFSEGLLLQDKDREAQGKLERCEPMVISPLAVEDGEGQRLSPSWVMERIKRCYPIIGLSCGDLEDKLLAVLEEIEAARNSAWAAHKTNYLSPQRAKGQRELHRLSWSINYEKKGAPPENGRHKSRVSSRLYEA